MKSNSSSKMILAAYVAGILGTFLILAGLIGMMYYYTRPAPVDEVRATERRKNLAELRAQNQELLENYGWIDKTKDMVRLPVTRAMELTVREWQSPQVARSNLLAQLDKLTAPAPKPPEKPNPYE